MLLAYAEEIYHLAVEIVQDLNLGWLLLEEHLCAARKRFDVCRVFRKDIDDLLRKRALASDVGQWTSHNSVSGFSGIAIRASIRPLWIEAWSHPKRVTAKEKTREPSLQEG